MENIKEILKKYKNIALVGASKDLTKTSSIVMKYLQDYGFKVYPVNPSMKGESILGEKVFGNIKEIDGPIEIVDVFRPSNEAAEIAKDAIKVKAKVLWLQLDIRNEEAKKIASKSNLTIKIGKQAFYKQLEMPLRKAYSYTSQMMTYNMMAMDAKEGISAFLEKRKPKWRNK